MSAEPETRARNIYRAKIGLEIGPGIGQGGGRRGAGGRGVQNGRRRNRVGGATHVKALMNRIINSLFFSISATARFISALSYCSRSSVVDWTPVRWRSSSDEDRISPRRIAARSSHLKVAGQEGPGIGRYATGRDVGRETMLCLRRPAARHDRPCAPPPPIRGQRLGWAASGARDRGC